MSGHVVVATGFNREAACLRGIARVVTVAGGGDAAALRRRIGEAADGAAGIVSFGLAGALADGWAIGDWVVADRLCGPTERGCDPAWREALAAALPDARAGAVYADGRLIDTVAEKLALGTRHGAVAVDMESQVAGRVAAERGLPFAIVRCISDGARHVLPPAITVSMRPDGGIDLLAMARSVATAPAQIPDLMKTIAGFARAMDALKRGAARIGPRLAPPVG